MARNEQLRRNMVSDVAHELRTPLTNIRGHLEAVVDGVLPANDETMESILEEAQPAWAAWWTTCSSWRWPRRASCVWSGSRKTSSDMVARAAAAAAAAVRRARACGSVGRAGRLADGRRGC